jgi:hypothetical protein
MAFEINLAKRKPAMILIVYIYVITLESPKSPKEKKAQ